MWGHPRLYGKYDGSLNTYAKHVIAKNPSLNDGYKYFQYVPNTLL